MATKNNPGPNDCYAKAAPDEPIFTLRAKDPVAPILILVWRALRAGSIETAVHLIRTAPIDENILGDKMIPFQHPKSIEAGECAAAMQRWRIEKDVKEKIDGPAGAI